MGGRWRSGIIALADIYSDSAAAAVARMSFEGTGSRSLMVYAGFTGIVA